MKKNLLYLFALICSMSLFTACDNTEDTEYIKTEFDGIYKGTLDVNAPSINLDEKGIPQKIYITKTGENLIKLELKKFVFQGASIGDIVIDNIAVVKKGNSCTFVGGDVVSLIVGECNVSVEGSIEGENTSIAITVNVGSLKVNVAFVGSKMAADQSSEAEILTFVFDNELVTVQPVIDNTNIFFVISEEMTNEQLAALVPTFTLSAGATVDKQSGVAQDFTKPVTYTVTSEDGIVKTVYTVSVSAKEKELNFDEWEVVKSATVDSKEKYEMPVGVFGSSNPGVMTINELFAQFGASFEYAVTPIAKDAGKAAQIKTLHTFIFVNDVDYNAAFNGMIPYVTAGSLFTGTFKTDMFNPLNSTKFGVPHAGKPVTFSGLYKYTAGKVYYDDKNVEVEGKADKCSVYAVLYEELLDGKGNNIPLTGDYKKSEVYIGTSSRIVMRAALADGSEKADWTSFSVPFQLLEGKVYDATKKYYLAIICSSSFEGDYYKGAPGSVLCVDDLSVASN